MEADIIKLTPAQNDFLQKHISGFCIPSWTVSSAGWAGSDRRFYRISKDAGSQTYVLIVWDKNDADWNRFLSIAKEVAPYVTYLPQIYAVDEMHGLILEEDLGEITLKKYYQLEKKRMISVVAMYRDVLDTLVKWQSVDSCNCTSIASRSMDLDMFLWESNYFAKHCVSEYFACESLLTFAWEKERNDIAFLATSYPKVPIHRDYQSENILLYGNTIRYVDFQGARLGPAGYDIASLVFDAYIPDLTHEISTDLFRYYQSVSPIAVSLESFYICALQRLMQALGAFANLSLHKGKDWYRNYIPVALARLAVVAKQHGGYPELLSIVNECLAKVV